MAASTNVIVVVTDFPYCGVGGHFCVALERDGATEWINKQTGETGRGPFPQTQPLVVAIPDTPANRRAYAQGSEWTLVPKEA